MEYAKPLTVTTPTHAIALTTYWSQVALGLLYTFDIAHARALTSLVGVRVSFLWALLLTASALACALAAHRAEHKANPVHTLSVEEWGDWVLAAMLALYEASLVIDNGFGVPTTQVFTAAVVVGALLRSRQIRKEQRRVSRALENVHYASPPPLAEAPGDSHQGG